MSEIVKATGEAVVDMITDLVNQIIKERVIPAEWELSTVVNYYRRKGDALKKEIMQGLK